MRSLVWVLLQYDCVLIIRGNVDIETDMHTERMPCEQAEIRVMYQQTKECQRLPENYQELGFSLTDSPLQPSGRNNPLDTSISNL